ncbi:MAG: hypothetical protein CM15mP78_08690 [Candidatus Poseidoniales archaeon]|nr:MAG: hypothetical protein CM15mP78_08690 [Candidatus Poseidoniales archaeon]
MRSPKDQPRKEIILMIIQENSDFNGFITVWQCELKELSKTYRPLQKYTSSPPHVIVQPSVSILITVSEITAGKRIGKAVR